MGQSHKSECCNLSGKTVLVTGSSGGVGTSLATYLARAGARVVIHSAFNPARGEGLAWGLNDEGFEAFPVSANLGSKSDIAAMMQLLQDKNWFPDLLVNNAGLQPVSALPEMSEDEWAAMMDINLKGVFLLTQRVCQTWMSEKIPGAVVNIASITGLDPAFGHAHYATSKSGLIMFTRACALEYGTHNIRVNTVSPGLIARDGLEDDWPEGVKSWNDNAPLTRLGTGEDIARAVSFLLSESAAWISGANLVVDGGMSASPRW